MMKISLLFDAAYLPLGEVMTENGIFRRVVLNEEGERKIGAYFTEWQTRGIPMLHHMTHARHDGETRTFFQERIFMRAPEFLGALQEWMAERRMLLVTVPSILMEYWELLLHLPLEAKERYMIFVTLRNAAAAELRDWKGVLVDAKKAVDAEMAIGSGESLSRVRQQAAKSLASALERPKKTVSGH